MHPNKKVSPKVLIGQFYGQHLHTFKTVDVDDNHKNKSEDVRIAKPAVLTTIESVRVKSIRELDLTGGIRVTAINGDANAPLKLNDQQIESIIKKSSQYEGETDGVRNIFGNYVVANEIANSANDGEIVRLTIIREDVDAQIAALKAAKEANNRAAAQFESENE
jgi:hypothetical protein